MISRYNTNQQKYKAIIDYIENHPNMLKDLKEDILSTIRKYRTLVSCLEEQEVCNLVDSCIKEGNKKILEKELNSILFGTGKDRGVSDKAGKSDRNDENIYNLD